MLRKALLAAAASERVRELLTAAPAANAVVSRYVAGESIQDALAVARALRSEGLLVSLDYLGEDSTDAQRAAATAAQYVHLLGRLAAEHLERIAVAARDAGTTVTVDAEDHTATDATLRIATALRERFGSVGSVVQAALRRTEADAKELAAPGVRVRLCKGAYAEPLAEAFTGRHDIDRSFARCLRTLMAGPGYPMIATHDPRLIAITRSLGLGRAPGSFEYQMLYGVRPDEQRRLAATGARVRVYVPYGGDWYRYLVRRLAERPANLALFLRSLRSSS